MDSGPVVIMLPLHPEDHNALCEASSLAELSLEEFASLAIHLAIRNASSEAGIGVAPKWKSGHASR